jgi:hypothetical protein
MLTDVQLENKACRRHMTPSTKPIAEPRATMSYPGETRKIQDWLTLLALVLPAFGHQRRTQALDVRGLSDHLKRDMGFLDGVPTDKRR